MDFDPPPYIVARSIAGWLQVIAVLAVLGLFLGLMMSVIKSVEGDDAPVARRRRGDFLRRFLSGVAKGGWRDGKKLFLTGLVSFVKDITTVSPRRVMALASLTLKEALRRKALLVFAVFAVLLMFGGWFLTNSNDRVELQRTVHVTFMLTTISWLILPVVMFLSCWGIPEDIRIRSIHTVVTKPVRRVEIVIGRMLGFTVMSTVILLLMAVVGYFWIQRQYPVINDDDGNRIDPLACRVPSYGGLYFLNQEGIPVSHGINVGDAWLYRSFVQGNSPARAVWLFSNVTPERLGGELRLESRFEAFRTVKGTDETIKGGIEAQYILVKNLRDDAFSSLAVGASFRPIAEALRAGQFQNAGDLLESASERMLTSESDFPVVDCQQLSIGCEQQVIRSLALLGESFSDVTGAFKVLGEKAFPTKDATGTDRVNYEELSRAAAALAQALKDKAPDLLEQMPAIEVPLEPFHVSEYHEGDDYITYPRRVSYAADYETTARHLAEIVGRWNDGGKILAGTELAPSLAVDLSENEMISPINAELLVDVLQAEIDNGSLVVKDGALGAADESRWLQYFDKIVREEKLISQDPAGWIVEKDIFDDLTTFGLLRVNVACLNDQMYLGMARPDLFIRLRDEHFSVGYSKAILNIGLMLGLVVTLGVTASCVVKGPVSFFFTLTVFVIGQFFHTLMLKILAGEEGGGLIESATLIYQHRNPSSGIDASESAQKAIESFDNVLKGGLGGASKLIPDFSIFSDAAAYIENGFDVPWNSSVLPSIMTFIGFLIPCVIIGAACLRFRELEAK